MHNRFILAITIALVLFGNGLQAAELALTIDRIKNNKGDVWITLFNSSERFQRQSNEDAIAMVKMPAKGGAVSVTLNGLNSGHYAIVVIHDENRNGEFDQRGVMPLEGYGYSNNVGANKAPTFDQAKIALDQGKSDQRISLIYYP